MESKLVDSYWLHTCFRQLLSIKPGLPLVPDGTPVRLRESVPNVKVWVLDKTGNPVAGRMDLPNGWYVLPDPGKE